MISMKKRLEEAVLSFLSRYGKENKYQIYDMKGKKVLGIGICSMISKKIRYGD